MQAIKQCYLAYINSEGRREPTGLDEILGDAMEMLPAKEYATLNAGVNEYCNALEEKAFATGFRFAVRLLAEGMQ